MFGLGTCFSFRVDVPSRVGVIIYDLYFQESGKSWNGVVEVPGCIRGVLLIGLGGPNVLPEVYCLGCGEHWLMSFWLGTL